MNIAAAAPSIRKAYRPDLTILVVEDHLLFCREIKHALLQHEVLFARTIEDAKKRYEESLPDLIFLDIELPDGSGFEFLSFIRSRELEMPVIMLTGSRLVEDVAASQQCGADGYIIKPFTKRKIERTLEQYYERREKSIRVALEETEHRRREAFALTHPITPDSEKNS